MKSSLLKYMAPTLVASRTALLFEGAAAPAVWRSQSRGHGLKVPPPHSPTALTIALMYRKMSTEGAGLAWGDPSLVAGRLVL